MIELLNKSLENTHSSVITLAEFYEQISELRSEMAERDASLRSEMAGPRAEFTEKMEHNKSSTIRWMFLFWVGQIGALIGIFFSFFR